MKAHVKVKLRGDDARMKKLSSMIAEYKKLYIEVTQVYVEYHRYAGETLIR